MEMGAGTGQLAYLLVRQLQLQQEYLPVLHLDGEEQPVRIHYILTVRGRQHYFCAPDIETDAGVRTSQRRMSNSGKRVNTSSFTPNLAWSTLPGREHPPTLPPIHAKNAA